MSRNHPDFIGPPEPIYRTFNIAVKPHGRGHMALSCWESFCWKQFASRELQGDNKDINQVHGAFGRMLFDFCMPDYTEAFRSLDSFEVGRLEDTAIEDHDRFRIRRVIFRISMILDGEQFDNEADIPGRLIEFVIGPYDA